MFKIMASELGFEFEQDVLIQCDREPVTDEDWNVINTFVEEVFPLSVDDLSHGFSPKSCKVTLPEQPEMSADGTFNIPLHVPAVYNPGEWRISKQITGPRGGKRWERLFSAPATGGYYPDAQLAPGLYKQTVWTNGWPSASYFEVTETGERRDV